jgi:hypothetical protein
MPKKHIQRMNETKSWFFEQINEIDKPLEKIEEMYQLKYNKYIHGNVTRKLHV